MYSQEKLLIMLEDSRQSVRYDACEWLRVSQESSPEVVNALEKATHDHDSEVAQRAKLALQADVHHNMAIQMGLIKPDQAAAQAEPDEKPSVVVCPSCQAENPSGARYCNQCATELPITGSAPVSSAHPWASQRKKSHRGLWIFLGGLGVLAILAIVIFIVAMGGVNKEVGPTKAVLDEFARHLADRDVQAAYAHCSPDFKAQIPISSLESVISGEGYKYIQGYQSLAITSFNVTWYPNATIAKVEGATKYIDGTGAITATLQKIGDTWMIAEFNFRKNIPTTP